MEFEKNAPVSDEQRRLADSKKITLQPTRTDIAPEDVSESEIASTHINGQPIDDIHNNVTQDSQTDNTSSSSTPNAHKQSALMVTVIAGIGVILIVASLFIFLL